MECHKRERVVLVGTRKNYSYQYPQKSESGIGGIESYKNVEEAIMDLVGKSDDFPNHISLNHGDKVLERYRLIPEGSGLPSPEDLPLEIRRKNFGNTYTRLHRKIRPQWYRGITLFQFILH